MRQRVVSQQEKEILRRRLQDSDTEKDKTIHACINVQRELEALKGAHKQVVNDHNLYLERQSDAQQTMEIKYEQQRQKMVL